MMLPPILMLTALVFVAAALFGMRQYHPAAPPRYVLALLGMAIVLIILSAVSTNFAS